MIKNVGKSDRLIRIIVGVLLIIGALMGYGWWMWIGIIPLATAVFNFCPLYTIFGINTCSRN